MVHDRLLDAENLAPFRTLILPSIAALSDAQCGELRRFVAGGGGLVATSETSLLDEKGDQRSDFGLSDLFGATWSGKSEGPMHNAYLRLEHEAYPAHPLLKGLEDAPRIINGVWRVEVAAAGAQPLAPLTLIPPYPDLPMEKVYPRQPRTDIAQVFLTDRPGGGRVVYFPWDIDRTFWEVLAVDHGKLMCNAVDWATNEPPPVTVTGPFIIIGLVKGPVRKLLPVGEQRVRVLMPEGAKARGVRLLVAGTSPEFREEGGWLELTVPSVTAHEVVAIDV